MIDYNLIFDGTPPSTGVAITSSRASTNVLDLGIGRDLGNSSTLELNVAILQTFTTGGGATLQIDFEGGPDNSTWFQLAYSPVYPVAQLIAGAPIFRYEWPMNQILNATAGVLAFPVRYVRLFYTVATSTFGAGTVLSWVSGRNDRNQFYAPAANYASH